ncbi:DDE-type integrase/transposase/recombinase [Comamonas sp. NLF-1-9]|uniref:DDE-type integrase/transposase/recombinase n=1 Tax=Comamonas sp. NLF-1-9 TaxID=2853163 RepID=UPI001C4852F6|nr:DDE-type integrase/transposase/recombinase [Comamonas sp. NLF-1-9]QXL84109.1 DDE-type integrase/transposase/recombinase [Comamonas sp. NLF-1-9]
MALNPALVPALVEVSQRAAAAPPGGKGAVYASACAQLACSLPTLHRWLAEVRVAPQRKQRADAGRSALTREEALTLSAFLQLSHRKTGKRLMSIGEALEILRANGELRAQRLDPATGELLPLSASAVARSLRAHGLHPDQINRPAPAVELKSLHPNHVWQIDASLCVLYYLHAANHREAGLQVMERERFYKNKPANLKRIEADRVWSYERTDHYSGSIAVHYVMGAESGKNLADSFIHFIQPRPGDPCHGVPRILMMDMGSANTSGLFGNLARRLGVQLIAHAPGNARATGQVEQARNLIERSFESGLRFRPVADLDELNQQAERWAAWFNAEREHTRHRTSRSDCWRTITAEQLRTAPAPEVCQRLLTHTPEARKVSVTLTVSFAGQEYDVRQVPGVMVGESLQVTWGVYQQDACTIVTKDADGHESLIDAPLVARDAGGFRLDANTIGEDWARPADTQLETHRKELLRHAYQASSDEAAEAAHKARAVPFGGRIDPGKRIDLAPERTWLPLRGTAVQPGASAPVRAARVLTHFEAAAWLTAGGVPPTPERHASVRAWHPEGVPEDQLDALKARLLTKATLRVVAS